MKITLVKYDNRKLYSRDMKKYVTLDQVEEVIQDGMEVEILDSKGVDVTNAVLSQLVAKVAMRRNSKTDMVRYIRGLLVKTNTEVLNEQWYYYLVIVIFNLLRGFMASFNKEDINLVKKVDVDVIKYAEILEDKIHLYEEILDLFDIDTLSNSKYNEFMKLYKRIGELEWN